MNGKRFRHALVVGKFYPPHFGHLHLIGMAADFSERVTVAVMGSSAESLGIDVRAAWLQADLAARECVRVEGILDDLPVDYADHAVWEGHVALMRKAVANADVRGAFPPLDAVFSSERYGIELGTRLGVRPVVLDPGRSTMPISGSAVRADVPGNWELLPPATRAGLCLRAVVMGAESTGTTTLCRDLRDALRARHGAWGRTEWVPEYGRDFSAALVAILKADRHAAMPQDAAWTEGDFLRIASEQTRREEAAAGQGGPYLLLDTDALATTVWHERYRGPVTPALRAAARKMRPRDLYVVTSPEGVAFEQDGLRDGEHLRLGMHERFRTVAAESGTAWMEAEGTREERVKAVLGRLDAIAKSRWTFSAPLPERNKP